MLPEVVFGMIITAATVLGVREWAPGLVQHLTGRAAREKERVQAEMAKVGADRQKELENLRQELYRERQEHRLEVARLKAEHEEEEREADVQACQRRILQEYVSELRGCMLQKGISVPPYPDLSVCRKET